MHTTNLRKVGGSVMLVVPPVLLNLLNLKAGATVEVDVRDGRLIVNPRNRPRYSLKDLLDASDFSQAPTEEDREWLDSPPVGRELL